MLAASETTPGKLFGSLAQDVSNFPTDDPLSKQYQTGSVYDYKLHVVTSVMGGLLASTNIALLILIIRVKSIRQSTSCFVTSLTVSDAILGTAVLSNRIWWTHGAMSIGLTIFMAVFQGVSIIASMSNLVVIGIDRCVAIFLPLKYHAIMTA